MTWTTEEEWSLLQQVIEIERVNSLSWRSAGDTHRDSEHLGKDSCPYGFLFEDECL